MTIRADHPQLKIILLKTTGVDFSYGGSFQYRGAAGGIDGLDLTALLGDAGTVHTSKSVDDPCGGFSISFADRVSNEGGDTVYALAEAMDMVEIRMARIPVGNGANPPLIMRGFITSIRRIEEIRPDGTPYRTVVIQGQDSGKLWLNHSILPEAQMATDLNTMLSAYQLFAATGILFGILPVAEFVTRFVTAVMNPAVAQMSDFAGRVIPEFQPLVSVPADQGWISASILQGFPGGRYWDVMEYVADRPWNEMWVRDREEGPQLIFRPVPYRDIGGGLIMPGAADPPRFRVDVGEIVKLDSVRSDMRTANFYWVPPGASQPDTAIMASVQAFNLQGGGTGGPLFSINHPNSALALYGLRKMEHETRLMPPDLPAGVSANLHPPGSKIEAGNLTMQWHIRRALQLNLLNRDNVVWETTEMTIKGDELLEAGIELEWTRGQFRGTGLLTLGYVTRCQHVFTPLKSGGSAGWTTQLTIERSDGFLNRDGMLDGSPYWREGRRGPYSPTS